MLFDRYRRIFQHRPFALFWAGFTFSSLGDAVTRVALTWFVYEATQSPAALGWLTACYTGPVILGGLLAGSLLDRFDRRKVMALDSLVRGLAVASIPMLYALGRLVLWHVYAVAGIYGLLMMISLAGGPALIPALVERDELPTANALETLSFVLAGILGPAAGGLLIGWIDAPYVIALDAASYLGFALLLTLIRPLDQPTAQAAPGDSAYNLRHAVRLLLHEKVLFATTFMYMAFNIGAGSLMVWLPILSDRVLKGGAGLYGFLLGTVSFGEVVSAFLAGSLFLPVTLGVLICLALIFSGFSLGSLLVGQSVWVVALGLALFGAFSAPLTIWAQTLRMQIIPERLRGRTFALLRMLMQSGNPIGGAIAGFLLPGLGLSGMIAFSALLVGLPGLLGLRVRELREADYRKEHVGSRPRPSSEEPLLEAGRK